MFIFCDEWILKLFFIFFKDERFYEKVKTLICLMLMLKLDIANAELSMLQHRKALKMIFLFFFRFRKVGKFDLPGERRAWFGVCSTRPQQFRSGAIVNSHFISLWKFFKYMNGLLHDQRVDALPIFLLSVHECLVVSELSPTNMSSQGTIISSNIHRNGSWVHYL